MIKIVPDYLRFRRCFLQMFALVLHLLLILFIEPCAIILIIDEAHFGFIGQFYLNEFFKIFVERFSLTYF